MAKWSDLPEDVINLFFQRLPVCVEEYVRFGCVCKSWRSASLNNQNRRLGPCAPWLMLTKSENDKMEVEEEEDVVKRCFSSVSTQSLFNVRLPLAQGRRCWGTPYGWLFTMGLDLNIHLLHPLSASRISLPPQPTFPGQFNPPLSPQDACVVFVTQFALASNPSSWTPNTPRHSTLVAALYGSIRKVAVAAPGDEAWTPLETPPGANKDIIFFDTHFYVVSTDGSLKICELDASPPKVTYFASPPEDAYPSHKFYLVEISGGLHLVERAITADPKWPSDEFHYYTDYFTVYKFDFNSRMWEEIEDLGGHALFVGNNTSFAISTSSYPQFKSNSIYFTDDHIEFYNSQRWCDMGVYDVVEDTIEPIHFREDQLSKFSRPLFFLPTLSC